MRFVKKDERAPPRDHNRERLVHSGVELSAGYFSQAVYRVFRRLTLLIGARGAERIVYLGSSNNSRAERDRLAGQSVRVPRPVPAFVMAANIPDDRPEMRQWRENLRANNDMLLDVFVLFGCQRAVLVH